MTHWLTNAIGTLAAICSMSSFAPQLFKVWQERDASSVSLKMFLLTVAGFFLWTLYGVRLGAWPVVGSNVVCLVLSAAILHAKWHFRDSGRSKTGDGSERSADATPHEAQKAGVRGAQV